MSTVLRVKRRFDHEPLDALVIAVKKRKLETGEPEGVISDVASTEVLKFAGTIGNPEADVVEHLRKTLTKEELKANYKQRAIDITSKARARAKEVSREHRYKVIKCFRSVDAASSQQQDDSVMTVIDVEHSKLDDAEKTPVLDEKEIGYVYDLYYTQVEENIEMDDDMTIHPFEQDLVFDSEETYHTRPDLESEDSNSESNVRNDYPDSENSENSIGDEDMQEAVRNLKIGDESSDLSSEDDFVYAADEADVEAYGYKYAKYKAKVMEELGESDSEKSDYVYAEGSYDEDEADDEDKHKEEED